MDGMNQQDNNNGYKTTHQYRGPYNTNQGMNMNQEQSQQNNGYGMNMNNNRLSQNAPNYMLWLILGILQICTLCCCNFSGPIFGVITVVLSIISNNAFKGRDMIEYQSKIKAAKIVCIVGFGFMIVTWILWLAKLFLSAY